MGSPCSQRGPASSLGSPAVPAAGVYALDDVDVLVPPPLLALALPNAIASCPSQWRERELRPRPPQGGEGSTSFLFLSFARRNTVQLHSSLVSRCRMAKREPPRSQEFIESSGEEEEQQEQQSKAKAKAGKDTVKKGPKVRSRVGLHSSSSSIERTDRSTYIFLASPLPSALLSSVSANANAPRTRHADLSEHNSARRSNQPLKMT